MYIQELMQEKRSLLRQLESYSNERDWSCTMAQAIVERIIKIEYLLSDKTYEVTLWLSLSSERHMFDEPPTKQVSYIVIAQSEALAIHYAKKMDTSNLSVWESSVTEL